MNPFLIFLLLSTILFSVRFLWTVVCILRKRRRLSRQDDQVKASHPTPHHHRRHSRSSRGSRSRKTSKHIHDRGTLQGHRESVRTLIVLGSGGHTAEMLTAVSELDRTFYTPLLYVAASSDPGSVAKAQESESRFGGASQDAVEVHLIPRSRSVGQSYVLSVFTTLWAILNCFWLVWKLRPDLILTNGPGTAIPVCWCAFMYRVLGFRETRVIFVESFCRVTSMSLTGILLYPIADRFVVQWKELQSKYPWTEFIPSLS